MTHPCLLRPFGSPEVSMASTGRQLAPWRISNKQHFFKGLFFCRGFVNYNKKKISLKKSVHLRQGVVQPSGRPAVTFIKETPNIEIFCRNRDGVSFFLAASSSESAVPCYTTVLQLLKAALKKILLLCVSREKIRWDGKWIRFQWGQ